MKLIEVCWVDLEYEKEESCLWFHPDPNATVPDDSVFDDEYDPQEAFAKLREAGFSPVESFVIGRDNWMW